MCSRFRHHIYRLSKALWWWFLMNTIQSIHDRFDVIISNEIDCCFLNVHIMFMYFKLNGSAMQGNLGCRKSEHKIKWNRR